jgi:N-acetylglucosamine malate deacetylase 1
MAFISFAKTLLHRRGVHPRRWLAGLLSYSNYIGYIKPHLLQMTERELRVRRQLLASAWEPRLLRAPVGKRLLAISPHPDDESIGAGGLLLAHRDCSEIHLLCLSDGAGGGSLGTPDAAPDALVKARSLEFKEASKMLGAASALHLDILTADDEPFTQMQIDRLRSVVQEIRPDVVLLPWFLDGHIDHRRTNILFARACGDLEMTVLGYEIWSMLEPNAIFDISEHLTDKLALIRNYPTQLRTVDYIEYVSGLAKVRAYHAALRPLRTGAAEAFVALPCREYCELISELYGLRDPLANSSVVDSK